MIKIKIKIEGMQCGRHPAFQRDSSLKTSRFSAPSSLAAFLHGGRKAKQFAFLLVTPKAGIAVVERSETGNRWELQFPPTPLRHNAFL